MTRHVTAFLVSVALLFCGSTSARAQGSTSTLSGVVTDASGGIVPGASVSVRNVATGVTSETTSSVTGSFTVPSLEPGTYTVTVTLEGFKVAVITNVRLTTGSVTEIKPVLSVGGLSESVEVKAGAQVVQTQTAAVQSTLSVEQISNLPLVTRNALNFLQFLPGVDTTSGPRNSLISGLPQNTINVTLDGVNVNNNLQSGDGFYSMVRPNLDAVEEVTVTGATPGAEGGGMGATQVQFVTRSGSNRLAGSLYYYLRHPSLNSNYFFNEINDIEKSRVVLHQYGGRVGGPIVIPGLVDGRNKAFFFFNHEEFRNPIEQLRTRNILSPAAQGGVFQYQNASGGFSPVDLLALAAANGQTSSPDPLISGLLNEIRQSTTLTGTVNPTADPNIQELVYKVSGSANEHLPTGRVDVNLTDAHRLSGTYYWQRVFRNPDVLNSQDPRFPGFPTAGVFDSFRNVGSAKLRSMISPKLVNELTVGFQSSPLEFGTNSTPEQFANQGGFSITPGFNLTAPTAAGTNGPSSRNTVNYSVDNSMKWMRGDHGFTFGASYTQITHRETAYNNVPGITLGVDTNNDPARGLFNQSNFPGASSGDLTSARALYALLTGRVSEITGVSRISESGSEYVYLGPRTQKLKLQEIGLFVQDSWRATPTLTLNGGVRYELQLPFTPQNGAYTKASLDDLCGISGVGDGGFGRPCNLFRPGAAAGLVPEFEQFEAGSTVYKTDWNNFAPNVGVAWRPNVQGGWLRPLLGDPEAATLRAGFSMSFTRNRMDEFMVYGGNPGSTYPASTRNVANGNLIGSGESFPLLLREANRLGPPPLPQVTYPILSTPSNSLSIIDPDAELGYVQSYSVGFQRLIARNTAIEISYVGNRNVNDWVVENLNEVNIYENGFLDEFRVAQQNLRANVAAGGSRANSFAYFGPGTGTAPLPIYLAYFSGRNDAGNPAAYGSSNFASSSWTTHLGLFEPLPESAVTNNLGAANSLHANPTFRQNAINAGLPRNFFVMNPDTSAGSLTAAGANNAAGANITRAVGGGKYHSMRFELRRALSRGLFANLSYTYSRRFINTSDTIHRDRLTVRTNGIPHAFKMAANYELPIGHGRRFGSALHPILNGLIGNWNVNLTGRVQWEDVSLTGVRVVGMDVAELQKAYKYRTVTSSAGDTLVYSLPQDIIDNTIKAFSTNPTSASGYGALGAPEGRYLAPQSRPDCIAVEPGDCGDPRAIFLRAPAFSRFDLSVKKQFPIRGRVNFEFEFDVLNIFDNVNFTPVFQASDSLNLNRVTSAYQDTANTFDPGGRLGQVIWRINW